MITESSAKEIPTSRPLKRSLFNRPEWSQPENLDNATDFFRRSDQAYKGIAAEAEQRRRRKIAEKQQQSTSIDTIEDPVRKRQGLSHGVDSADDADSPAVEKGNRLPHSPNRYYSKTDQQHVDKPSRSADQVNRETSPRLLSERYSSIVESNRSREPSIKPASNIIELEDDDGPVNLGHEENEVSVIAVAKSRDKDDDDFPPSDDEFAELARKAREKARRLHLERDLISPSPDPSSTPGLESQFQRSPARSTPQPTPPPPPDPVIQILLTSRIPNTNPLIVNRKASQRLKDVRIAWCQRQGFTPEFTGTVFLAWRGKRLFDVTTCKSLGIGVDVNGNIVLKGQKDVLGEEERQIHMEAMTDAIYEEYKKARHSSTDKESTTVTQTPEEPPTEAKKEAQVRIVLKAKGFDDFKLIVKEVSRMAGVPLDLLC